MVVGVLASGIIGMKVIQHLFQSCHISFIFTDKASKDIIEICEQYKIDLFLGNPRNGRSDDFIRDKSIDVLISVNYLFLIDRKLIDLPRKFAFNIHGSLLPKYRGRTPHVWSIINNEKKTGITAHLIDDGCDTGDIISQIELEIDNNDTGGSILTKYAELYIPLVDEVLKSIDANTVSFKEQKNELASYFGKRTAEDGKINWDWQKERINNWIRAQAYPYPGAFALYHDKKIIIDKIAYCDYGYTNTMRNGLIISSDPLLIKTSNGVIEILELRTNNTIFKIGHFLE